MKTRIQKFVREHKEALIVASVATVVGGWTVYTVADSVTKQNAFTGGQLVTAEDGTLLFQVGKANGTALEFEIEKIIEVINERKAEAKAAATTAKAAAKAAAAKTPA